MSKNERIGKLNRRGESVKRFSQLKYYLIVTDTEKTEKNYLLGLKKSLSENDRKKVEIKVKRASTVDLVENAKLYASQSPQNREVWIVFDRDKVTNFNNIIQEAESAGFNVGWSNPCIEIWFFAYFGEMPTCTDSKICCSKFGEKFKNKTKHKYNKADTKIYDQLIKYGNENTALSLANIKMKGHLKNPNKRPSTMNPCTTLHRLVSEIRNQSIIKEKSTKNSEN